MLLAQHFLHFHLAYTIIL